MRRLAAVGFVLAAALSLPAEPLSVYDLMYSVEQGIPSFDLPEPYPWGLMPSMSQLRGVKGDVSELRLEEKIFSYAFEQRTEKSASMRRYALDMKTGDCAVDDRTIAWREGESRFYWDLEATESRLLEWRGAWSSPLYIRAFEEGSDVPVETWERVEGQDRRWAHSAGDDVKELWILTTEAGTSRWTCYDDDGEAVKRLLVVKDAKGAIARVESWNSPGEKDFELSIVRGETSSILKARTDETTKLEVRTAKSPPSMTMTTSSGDAYASETRYSMDTQGRCTELSQLMEGKVVQKLAFQRDAVGNVISRRHFEAKTIFGEARSRESWNVTFGITYRKPGQPAVPTVRPPEIDSWLGLASESSMAPGSSESPLEYLPGESRSPGKWIASASVDPLTDAKEYYCVLSSMAPSGGASGSATLVVRKQEDGIQVYVNFNEILEEKASLALRFDSEAPVYIGPLYWGRSTDSQAAFLYGYEHEGEEHGLIELITMLRQKRILFAQAEKYDGTKVSAKFELPGLRAALEELVPMQDFLQNQE